MSGSVSGVLFKISTWGESHGKGLGVVIDGCPSGIDLREEDIQSELDRRKPGVNKFATKRTEADRIEILSGVFNGITTGTPISLVLYNTDTRSHDYGNISQAYRPGHADYGYDMKYGFRDYRGGGRSSGRETAARVAAGAVAKKILQKLNISIDAYIISIGNIDIDRDQFSLAEARNNPLCMPDRTSYEKASAYLEEMMQQSDSAGGTVECVVKGVPPGVGEPVFQKLDAEIGKMVLSLGAVKGIEFGSGFMAARANGSTNNDEFYNENGKIIKKTNNAGGILGGMSDGSDIVFRAAFKPTSSIAKTQHTINSAGENIEINTTGRHDPIIAPRAVVVVEAVTAITIVDLLLVNMVSKIENITKIYQ